MTAPKQHNPMRKALYAALGVHLCAALLMLWQMRSPKIIENKKMETLELVALPASQPPSPSLENAPKPQAVSPLTPPEPTVIPTPAQKTPEIKEIPELIIPENLFEKPQKTKPQPKETPKPSPKPAPKPINKPKASVEPKKQPAKPAPKPAKIEPKTPPKTQKISQAAFFDKKGKAQKPKTSSPAVKTTQAPRLELPQLDLTISSKASALAKIQTPSSQVASSNRGPTAETLALLRTHIDRFWKKPTLSKPLKAQASFVVSKNGSLSDFRIERSSGNTEFDRSIQYAVQAVRIPQVPAELNNQRFTLSFVGRP